MSVGTWAWYTGAGWLGAIVVTSGLTLGVGQVLLETVRPVWARLLVVLAFVAPAALAGYHAVHGIVKHAMPSEARLTAFSVFGAVAVGVTAFMQVARMTTGGPARPEPGMARS